MKNIKNFAEHRVNEFFFPELEPLEGEAAQEADRVSADGTRVRELADEMRAIIANHPIPRAAREAERMLDAILDILD